MRAVVLLSAGLDSTVNFYVARTHGTVDLALTFNYGQRAAEKEIQQAKKIAAKYSVKHQVVELPFVKSFGKSSLLDNSEKVPVGQDVQMDDLKISQQTAKSVWVPNRNGIFLNVAAGFAEALGAQFVVPGFNVEEAQTFPDNSQGFLTALDQSFSFSTDKRVQTKCFTTELNKIQIVQKGKELKVDWNLIWPCYFSAEKWCGRCESCQRSLRALKANDISYSHLVEA